jgi:translation initiation factor 2 alpha subunit (eIF-2alpha)
MIDDLLNVQILAQLESEGKRLFVPLMGSEFWSFCLSVPTIVEAGIEAQIDQMVKQQVAEELKKHIPQEQQDELVRVKGDLEKVQRALHNSLVHRLL